MCLTGWPAFKGVWEIIPSTWVLQTSAAPFNFLWFWNLAKGCVLLSMALSRQDKWIKSAWHPDGLSTTWLTTPRQALLIKPCCMHAVEHGLGVFTLPPTGMFEGVIISGRSQIPSVCRPQQNQLITVDFFTKKMCICWQDSQHALGFEHQWNKMRSFEEQHYLKWCSLRVYENCSEGSCKGFISWE